MASSFSLQTRSESSTKLVHTQKNLDPNREKRNLAKYIDKLMYQATFSFKNSCERTKHNKKTKKNGHPYTEKEEKIHNEYQYSLKHEYLHTHWDQK